MVRLEKLAWEQLANVNALGRQRVIASPSKWYNVNRFEWMLTASHIFNNTGITSKIVDALLPIISRLTYRYTLDIAHQRGMTIEDTYLFTDRELRRCYFFETLARQNLHPYSFLFMKKRRARYFKVERGVRGFFVPEWVRKEAEDREFSKTAENIFTWNNFVHNNYMSDLTPAGRWSHIQKINPLDLFSSFGWFRVEAWERYFYNEVYYSGYTQEEMDAAKYPFSKYDLGTSEGRAQFERAVNRFAELFPFTITRPGEQFDFNTFYAKEALINGRDVSGFDQNLISNLRQQLQSLPSQEVDNGQNKTQKIKARLPDWVQPKAGQALQ